MRSAGAPGMPPSLPAVSAWSACAGRDWACWERGAGASGPCGSEGRPPTCRSPATARGRKPSSSRARRSVVRMAVGSAKLGPSCSSSISACGERRRGGAQPGTRWAQQAGARGLAHKGLAPAHTYPLLCSHAKFGNSRPLWQTKSGHALAGRLYHGRRPEQAPAAGLPHGRPLKQPTSRARASSVSATARPLRAHVSMSSFRRHSIACRARPSAGPPGAQASASRHTEAGCSDWGRRAPARRPSALKGGAA